MQTRHVELSGISAKATAWPRVLSLPESDRKLPPDIHGKINNFMYYLLVIKSKGPFQK